MIATFSFDGWTGFHVSVHLQVGKEPGDVKVDLVGVKLLDSKIQWMKEEKFLSIFPHGQDVLNNAMEATCPT